MLPIPKKLVKQGVRDMVRLSDSRMSGTSYGACILHVSPESYIGGPLALVKTGDMISLDVDKRTIDMNVSDEELAKRRAAWKKPEPRYERGYGWMFTQHIKQANEGCDFDFLETELRRARWPNRRSTEDSSMALKAETRDKLKTISTATVATALFKRGFRNQFIQDVHPLSPVQPVLVGEAFTLRYMPAREDLNQLAVFRDRGHPQRKAIEDCPPGAVMVMDSRKDARAASAGSILVTRLMKRGVAGVVTDGGFRDSAEIARAGLSGLSPPPQRADQPHAASGDRHQRADRLRRRAGLSRRRDPGRQRRRHRHPRQPRRRDRRGGLRDDGLRGFRHRAGQQRPGHLRSLSRRPTSRLWSTSPLGES